MSSISLVLAVFRKISLGWSVSSFQHRQDVDCQSLVQDMESTYTKGGIVCVTGFLGGRSLLPPSLALVNLGLSNSFFINVALTQTWFMYATNFSIFTYFVALQ